MPAIWRDVVRDDGAIASALGNDGLRGVVGSIHIDVGQVAQEHIAPGEPRIACTGLYSQTLPEEVAGDSLEIQKTVM